MSNRKESSGRGGKKKKKKKRRGGEGAPRPDDGGEFSEKGFVYKSRDSWATPNYPPLPSSPRRSPCRHPIVLLSSFVFPCSFLFPRSLSLLLSHSYFGFARKTTITTPFIIHRLRSAFSSRFRFSRALPRHPPSSSSRPNGRHLAPLRSRGNQTRIVTTINPVPHKAWRRANLGGRTGGGQRSEACLPALNVNETSSCVPLRIGGETDDSRARG